LARSFLSVRVVVVASERWIVTVRIVGALVFIGYRIA
jgi:hypothetical protein